MTRVATRIVSYERVKVQYAGGFLLCTSILFEHITLFLFFISVTRIPHVAKTVNFYKKERNVAMPNTQLVNKNRDVQAPKQSALVVLQWLTVQIVKNVVNVGAVSAPHIAKHKDCKVVCAI